MNVTAPGGTPCVVPERKPRRPKKTKPDGDADGNTTDEGDEKPKGGGRKGKPRFDDGFPEEVKETMKEKKLDMRQPTILVSVDNARLKFGPDGFAALCHADGIMAEGTFGSDATGQVAITWRNVLKFEDGAWIPSDPFVSTSSGSLITEFNWSDGKSMPERSGALHRCAWC